MKTNLKKHVYVDFVKVFLQEYEKIQNLQNEEGITTDKWLELHKRYADIPHYLRGYMNNIKKT